jgi:general secretion pathway protein H
MNRTHNSNTSRTGRHDGESGVTLLEMLVVLVIIGLGYSVTMPLLTRTSPTVELRVATQDLGNRLRSARSTAIVRQDDIVVHFDLEKRTYVITGLVQAFKFGQSINMTVTSARDARGASTRAAIAFFADGSSSGGEIKMQLGETRTVLTVNWLTGVVGVEASNDLP